MLVVGGTQVVSGQDPDSLPSFYGDKGYGFCPLRQNQGQTLNTNGGSVSDISYYFERTPYGIFLRTKSKVSFNMAELHDDSTTNDTLYRIDMTFAKGRSITPVHVGFAIGDISNYYKGSIVVEEMKAYDAVVYRSVWDSINVYFFRSTGGPRMAYAVLPGGDPSDITLKFAGQDSLRVDWGGALEVYLKNRWIEINEAVAYQVDANNDVIPLNWTGEYEHTDSSAFVTFGFDTYNEQLPLILEIGYPPIATGGGGDYRNLNWSTYAGSNQGDELECVEVDSDGNPYVCGYVQSAFFPIYEGYMVFPPFIAQPPSSQDAVVMKMNAETKQTLWATYYGGLTSGAWTAKSKAHKLAVFESGSPSNLQYVFVTGSTNATDFDVEGDEFSPFADAFVEGYDGGVARTWVGAFRKGNGIRDWATTHGETGDATWKEHGLAIDVDDGGKLVVGGQIEALGNANTIEPDFPLVTPTGAFSRAVGGGFFIVFNDEFQIHWATTFGEFDEPDCFTKVTDLRVDRMLSPNRDVIWLAGTSSSGTGVALNTVPLGSAYYQASSSGPSAMIARIDISDQHQIEYCTRWGDSVTEAYGLEITANNIWVVGYTSAIVFDTDMCPYPGGSGVHYSMTHAGSTYSQGSDGFILQFKRSPVVLNYGTLIGGLRDDILLDVNSTFGHVFVTGETRSSTGFSTDLDPSLYFQPQNDIWNKRDALILSLEDSGTPSMLWRTPFGGSQSERGWGIAASATEVYLVGATASQQFEDFPLWDFDAGSQLDLFQDWNLGGSTSMPFVPFYQFCGAMDHEFTQWGVIEGLNTPHDGFLAAFGMQLSVGMPDGDAQRDANALGLIPTGVPGQWLVKLPNDGTFSITIQDGTGRLVFATQQSRSTAILDLRGLAAGSYVVVATDRSSKRTSGKLLLQ